MHPVSPSSCCFEIVSSTEGEAVEPCAACQEELSGVTRLTFKELDAPDSLLVVNIKASTLDRGWGGAMVQFLQNDRPTRRKWYANSVNVESEWFWEKLKLRGTVTLLQRDGTPFVPSGPPPPYPPGGPAH